MKMTFRWFGADDDAIALPYIRQIPGVSGVVGALFDLPVGQAWPIDRIAALKSQVEQVGLTLEVIESVNIHDDIKIGLPSRDHYIDNYIATIERLAAAGVKVICYNFMPVFDWMRTDLRFPLADGSFALAYDDQQMPATVEQAVKRMADAADGFLLPGWEPERLADIRALFDAYGPVDEAQLADNFRYFIEAIMPVCEQTGMMMAVHPDDPPWPIFGLPRVVKNIDDLRRIEAFHDSPANGFTICTGSLGENPDNDVVAILGEFLARGKVPFVHARNIAHTGYRQFHESPHLSSTGSIDMFKVMKTLVDADYQGYVRPDHGRDIWGEVGRPGYGLHDRALGVTYLNGLWEGISRSR
ncbi:MAG: mannonate dehydratase [Propionibacteriaceae bacterium]|jgi:mannonate dehydratase|nr:mannonate dehydratase [Propionibacteriaceae bacterium]